MKKTNTAVSEESLNEYLRLRATQYIEKMEKGMKNETETEFYSNIMEIVSVIDFTGTTMTIENNRLMSRIRTHHFWRKKKGNII